jgi:phospholipid transport system substrate-binding protein
MKMVSMKTMRLFAFVFALLGLAFATPAMAVADTPATVAVKNFYSTLTSVMKQGDQLGFAGRYKKLAPAIRKTFNLPLMARFAVGPTWLNATPDEQQQLISAFSDFSVATYASRFTKYDGEKFDVVDEKPASGGGVIVETRLIPKDSDPIPLNYLVKPDDQGVYRIVDVFLDGSISQLATERADFTSIVRRDGIPALVNQLGEKSKEMGPS